MVVPGGAWVVALGGGMHGCSGGACAVTPGGIRGWGGVCVVAPGGMHGCSHGGHVRDTTRSQLKNALERIVSTFNGEGDDDTYRLLFAAGHLKFGKRERDICRLLFAAGETLDGIPDEEIPDCLKFDDLQLELKHICREAIRKHLLSLDPHTHLFGRVPRLGLPSLLTEYLLYQQTLDDDDIEENNNDSDEKSEESKISNKQ